jgi:hypothetical protein
MASLSRRQRHAVVGLVVIGAFASIATSALPRGYAWVDLPPVHLYVEQPTATVKLHVALTGDAKQLNGDLELSSTDAPPAGARVLISAPYHDRSATAVLGDSPYDPHPTVRLHCTYAPCEEDVAVRFDLLPLESGSFPASSVWTLHGELDVFAPDGADANDLSDVVVTIAVVP